MLFLHSDPVCPRFPHGWYRIDYALEGDLKEVELRELQQILTHVPHSRLSGGFTGHLPPLLQYLTVASLFGVSVKRY
jgi:hypothetical protein